MNIDIFNKLDNKSNDKSSFITNFMQELNNYLNKDKNEYQINVASDPNKDGKVYLRYFDKNNNSRHEFKDINELPEGTKYGTRLIYKNGAFTIDEEETKQRLSEIEQVERETKELVAQYKQENVDYLIKYKNEDGFDVQNQKTGLVFWLSKMQNLTNEQYETFQEDMIINYKDGKYVVKE